MARSKSYEVLRSVAGVLAAGAMAWACAVGQAATAAPEAGVPAVAAPARQAGHPDPNKALDDRMALMTKELNLDARQQDSIRTLLLLQRSEMIKAWSDPSVPAAVRVSAVQGISERTADRIRSVLTDAQREKYIKWRPHETPVGAPGGDVEKWMKPAQPH